MLQYARPTKQCLLLSMRSIGLAALLLIANLLGHVRKSYAQLTLLLIAVARRTRSHFHTPPSPLSPHTLCLLALSDTLTPLLTLPTPRPPLP